jgi:DMAP1-binding Domain
MRKICIIGLVISIVLCVTLTSCGGGGAKVESTVSTQTLGQQLIDLDKAYKEGVITEKEYKKSKEALMEKYE